MFFPDFNTPAAPHWMWVPSLRSATATILSRLCDNSMSERRRSVIYRPFRGLAAPPSHYALSRWVWVNTWYLLINECGIDVFADVICAHPFSPSKPLPILFVKALPDNAACTGDINRAMASVFVRRVPRFFDAYISPARSFRITSSLSTSKPLSSHLHPSQRTFTSTSNNMGADSLIQGFKARRTHYALKPESPISDDKIHEIVEQAILHTPSSFNSQSTRVLVLLADQHKKLWEEIVKPAVKAVAPPEAWESSEKRLSGFSNAYGTVNLQPHLHVNGCTNVLRSCSMRIPMISPSSRNHTLSTPIGFRNGLSTQMLCISMPYGLSLSKRASVPTFSTTIPSSTKRSPASGASLTNGV